MIDTSNAVRSSLPLFEQLGVGPALHAALKRQSLADVHARDLHGGLSPGDAG